MRIAAAASAAVFAVLVAVLTLINSHDLPPDELVRRCGASMPAWNGYQEDIKEIGARPVALWAGEPVALEVTAGGVRLEMALEPPWDGWDAALPVLLKDPLGNVHRQQGDEQAGALRIYRYPAIPGADRSMPPWVEVQYPHTKRRLHLDAAGRWVAGGGP